MKVGNHNYFLSWREPWHKFEVRWRRADLGLHTPHSLSDLADQPDVDKTPHPHHLAPHTSLIFRTGTGSMDAISAEIVVWISCLSIHPGSLRCFPRS